MWIRKEMNYENYRNFQTDDYHHTECRKNINLMRKKLYIHCIHWTSKIVDSGERVKQKSDNGEVVYRHFKYSFTYLHLLWLNERSIRVAFSTHLNHYRWHIECRLMHCSHDLGQVKQQNATRMPSQVSIQHRVVYQYLRKMGEKKHWWMLQL